ncbi:hypothetical protein OPT61_g8388 [Boeremia exigua]|uniref:Uncharacterized protein n=1 Tax=Boeremia exigua TaxID=749465 RepID=A0ACC2HYF0_9PLEO|nr:hypothetical protein OPT61_g8388 [Boeremia exigua]
MPRGRTSARRRHHLTLRAASIRYGGLRAIWRIREHRKHACASIKRYKARHRIYRWDDERPLIGYRTKNRKNTGRRSYTKHNIKNEVHDLYAAFDRRPGEPHPSRPPDRMIPKDEILPLHLQFKAANPVAYQIYKANWNNINIKIKLYKIYFNIYNNSVVSKAKVPKFQLHKITARFVEGVHIWMKQQNISESSPQWPRAAHWTQGAEWQTTKKFNGFLQLQHLDIIVLVQKPSADPGDSVNAVKIPVSTITTRGTYNITPADIHIAEISLSRLVEEVSQKGYPPFSMQTYVFTYPGADDEIMVIDKDAELHTAILSLQRKLLVDIEVEEAAEIELYLDLKSQNMPGAETNAVPAEKRKRINAERLHSKKKQKRRGNASQGNTAIVDFV